MSYIVIGLIILVVLVKFVKDGNAKTAVVRKSALKPVAKKPTTAQLKKLTKNQLVVLADKHNISVKKGGAKASVVAEIRDGWDEGDDFEEE